MPYQYFHFLESLFTSKKFFCLLFTSCLFSFIATAQPQTFSSSNAHAHNDYLHPVPFYTAYNAGFGSIEVDIFPLNGTLYVAHSKHEIQPQRTLKSSYLDPLLKVLAANNSRPVQLLVDIKENYKASLSLLILEIEPLKEYLSTPGKKKLLTILISGYRPTPAEYKNYPAYIFFDDDIKMLHDEEEWKRVALVSQPFVKYSAWKGENALDEKDIKLLRYTIDSVHLAGKKIRFWAAPDNEASWTMQIKLGVDFIGTDKIDEFVKFLQSRIKNK